MAFLMRPFFRLQYVIYKIEGEKESMIQKSAADFYTYLTDAVQLYLLDVYLLFAHGEV